MFKTAIKVVVVGLVVIGSLNFHALNKSAFKAITTTITTKPLGVIPGEVATVLISYPWEFTR